MSVDGVTHVGAEAGRAAVASGPLDRDGAQLGSPGDVERHVVAERFSSGALELRLPVDLELDVVPSRHSRGGE